jgi:hypothetical protein
VTPTRRARVFVAIAFGLFGAAIASWSFRNNPQWGTHDFGYAWVGGRAVLEGRSPYEAVKDTAYHLAWDRNYKYPMTAALVAAPLATLPQRTAGLLFVGLSFAWLAFALSQSGLWRLGVLVSGPALYAARAGQWAPFLVAASMTAGLEWLTGVKPTVAFALFAWRPRWRTLLGGAALCVVSLLILPAWPREWLALSSMARKYPPVGLQPAGAFALLAALRWRTSEGRLALAMAFVPVTPWIYDALPLLLVARTRRELALIAVPSGAITAAYLLQFNALGFEVDMGLGSLFARYIMIFTVYLPATVIVLRHPNIGDLPGWAERATRRLPLWVRGSPATT